MDELISSELILPKILILRGKKVILDRDLAGLYVVSTKVLNQAVRRNIRRFPVDFMFRLTKKERLELVTICDRFRTLKHSTSEPFVFTEQGVAMLSSVLNSERAILVNIAIMRAFVQLRRMLLTNADLRRKIEQMERKYDKQFAVVFQAIKQLLEPPQKAGRVITGFKINKKS
ncbi:MAG: ORF6N domain-containing protein [Candidatus Omnitrophica bacterium]|nr:ORF6N domain-containing protein [Candidatus Omnitrophota bacterium]MBU1870453.1 ORF6N domain-containing protein [Candidatus Omnitrophota bacterium]